MWWRIGGKTKAWTLRIHCRSPQVGEHPIPSGKTWETPWEKNLGNPVGKDPGKTAGTEHMTWLRLAGKGGKEECRS